MKNKSRLEEIINDYPDISNGLALLTVIIQLIHTQYILNSLSSLGDYSVAHSSAIAFVLSFSIMIFILKGIQNIAIGASIFESLMNICYYSLFLLNQYNTFPTGVEKLELIIKIIVSVSVSFSLPALIGLFTYYRNVNRNINEKASPINEEALNLYIKKNESSEMTVLKKGNGKFLVKFN